MTLANKNDAELMSPRPSLAHSDTAGQLFTELEVNFGRSSHRRGGPGGWFFLLEPELRLSGAPRPVAPDLAAWRRERLPHLPRRAALDMAPDWICEVLSTSTAVSDRLWKLPLYFTAGVSWVWLLHPLLQMLEVFGRSEAGWVLHNSLSARDRVVTIAPFESVPLPLEQLWPDLDAEV